MAENLASTPPAPRYTGMRYLDPLDTEDMDTEDMDTEDMDTEDMTSIMINYSYNGAWYCVLVSGQETRPGYELAQSIEGKILIELSDLSWGEESQEKDRKITELQSDLARLAGDACLLLMKTLTPLPVPEEQTFQDHLYPEIHTLQVLTEGGKLVSHKLDGYDLPERHPPIPESRLQEIGLDDTIPVFKPSEIMLGTRLQGLVWKVNVNGEDMICKITLDIFEDAIGRELETYQKIRNADLGNDLKVPQLRGKHLKSRLETFPKTNTTMFLSQESSNPTPAWSGFSSATSRTSTTTCACCCRMLGTAPSQRQRPRRR